MMGRSHFVSGIVAFEATAAWMHYTPEQAVIGVIVATSASLLPDIDHQHATISRTYGPITVGVSRVIAKLAGGHRRGTHSLLGIGAFGLLAQACVMNRHTVWAAALLSAILIVTIAAGVRILRIPGWIDDLAPIPVVVFGVAFTNIDLSSVPAALVLGCVTHVIGDCLTNSGCPILWPLSDERLKFGLFRTGKWAEKWVVFPVLVLAACGMYMWKVWATIT